MNELGKFLRKYRIDEDGMSLRQMSTTLGVSPSLLSAYETGRRPIPNGDELFDKLTELFPMGKKQRKELRRSIDSSVRSYRVDVQHIDPKIRDQYVAFARKLPGFSAEDFEKLKEDWGEED